jgi:hypothetical protein
MPVAKYQMSPAELAAARMKETKRLPAATMAVLRNLDAEVAAERARVASGRIGALLKKLADVVVRAPLAWIGVRLAKLNPLALLDRRGAPKPAIPRFGKEPVQAELSLDNIRVVRNDLNESDVELVPAKAETKPKAKPVLPPEALGPVAEPAELIKT